MVKIWKLKMKHVERRNNTLRRAPGQKKDKLPLATHSMTTTTHSKTNNHPKEKQCNFVFSSIFSVVSLFVVFSLLFVFVFLSLLSLSVLYLYFLPLYIFFSVCLLPAAGPWVALGGASTSCRRESRRPLAPLPLNKENFAVVASRSMTHHS